MTPWMDVAEQHLPQWELDLDETTYEQEIRDFWKKSAPTERKRVDEQIKKESEKAEAIAKQKEAEANKSQATDQTGDKAWHETSGKSPEGSGSAPKNVPPPSKSNI